MQKWRRRILGAVGVVLAGAQLIRPERTNPVTDPQRSLAALQPAPAAVSAILERGCRDCHSNDTRWPWYSHVAPVSWFVIDHVDHGRSHFNYSDWARYEPAERQRLRQKSCELAREAAMPLASYAALHRSAQLSRADVDALCAWAQGS